MPSVFLKQLQKKPSLGLNYGTGQQTVGGTLTSLPSNVQSPFVDQDMPGDRMIVGSEDATALSYTTVGTLYGGLYTRVLTYATVTAAYNRGCAVFWDTSVADSTFRVIPDETGSQGINPFAGIIINLTITAGYAAWVVNGGKVFAQFRSVLTGVPSNGCPVYLAGAGAGADVGTFDVLDGAPNPTFTQVGAMIARYAGWAEGLPVASGLAVPIHLPMDIVRF